MSQHDKTLSQLAVEAMQGRRAAPYPPTGNTGGISRHGIDAKGKNAGQTPGGVGDAAAPVPQNTPPRTRRSRARQTSADMQRFLDLWFFDWLTTTVQNPETGKGQRPEGAVGDQLEADAVMTMTRWALSQGLHCIGIGTGSDGFEAGARLALSPVDKETVGRIRSGHKTNMPGLELTGADGACDRLARSALDLLGPVLIARADATLDWSQPGLWDDLLAYAQRETGSGAGKGMNAPRITISETGRTFYWGGEAVSVKVYEKDKERFARDKIEAEDVDEDLVRVEFTFRPDTDQKAAFAALTPGQMIGTSRWARRMVIEMAQLIGYAGRDADMAETRVERMPDASTVHDRAEHVIRQAARTCIGAAAESIVREEHDGDWNVAIDPDRLHARAMALISSQISDMGTAVTFVTNAGLERVRSGEERAQLMAEQLEDWIGQRRKDREAARGRLLSALDQVGLGVSSSGAVAAAAASSGASVSAGSPPPF